MQVIEGKSCRSFKMPNSSAIIEYMCSLKWFSLKSLLWEKELWENMVVINLLWVPCSLLWGGVDAMRQVHKPRWRVPSHVAADWSQQARGVGRQQVVSTGAASVGTAGDPKGASPRDREGVWFPAATNGSVGGRHRDRHTIQNKIGHLLDGL